MKLFHGDCVMINWPDINSIALEMALIYKSLWKWVGNFKDSCEKFNHSKNIQNIING